MLNATTPHDVNVIGAFALALADELSELGPAATTAVLVVLGQKENGQTINTIARALNLSQPRAVRIADALEEAGLARRVQSTEDRRVVRVRLTRKGRTAAARVQRARTAKLEHMFRELSSAEVSQLCDLVSKVLRSTTTGHDHAQSICRLCDAMGCGHYDGRCPVTAGALAHDPAG